MMWIAKVQEPMRDDEGKLIRDNEGNLSWGYGDGSTYEQYGVINHTLPANHPKWVTVVPKRWIRFDTEGNIYFRGQKCTVFTEKDQDKYGVGYYGPRHDLRYSHIKGKIPEVIKPTEPRVSEPSIPQCKGTGQDGQSMGQIQPCPAHIWEEDPNNPSHWKPHK